MGEAFRNGFRIAMRSLTSAVTIISVTHCDRRFGMTATAVSSLSMEPPSLLACVNQSASIHGPMLDSGRFCVNILHANQTELASAFSDKKAADRFAFGAWAEDAYSFPYLVDAQANVFCDVD